MYYKRPLIGEPEGKINWNELIDETKKFMAEKWTDAAPEYISRFCKDINIIDPFNGETITIGKDAKSMKEVTEG